MRAGFTSRSAITHRVDVRRFAAQKQAALAAHRTQVYGRGRAGRLFRLLVRLPVSLFGLVAGREWFAEPGGESARPIGDVLQPAPRAEGTVRR
jgi:LmbE family N-acetylglucosaminyl deacetylase